MKTNKGKIGWFCSYAPVEFIDAAGFVPVRVEGQRGSMSRADSIMHTNICPFVKACVEKAESGALKDFTGFVFTNGCDAQRRMYDIWRTRWPETPAHLVAVPKGIERHHVERLAVELLALREWLESLGAEPITDDALRASNERYAALRAALRELPPMPGSRAMELHLEAQRTSPDDALETLRRETANVPEMSNKGASVLLYGNMMDDPEFVRGVEKYGVRVIADDLCAGRRFRETPAPDPAIPPVNALAAAYMSKSHCPRMTCEPDTVDRFRETLVALKPDGVIFHTLKFCDTHLYDLPRLREVLREADIRGLFLEGDYSGSGAGQLETRIQAFVELLEQ